MTPRKSQRSDARAIRLLIADDHAIVRFGLSTLLQYEDDITIVAEAEDGAGAVRLAEEQHPDVAVIDLAMPNVSGVEAIRQIRRTTPETRIIVYTSFSTSEDLVQALDLGVVGIVLKDTGNDVLIDAIRRVARGETIIPEELLRSRTEAPDIKLSQQELDALAALARGLTNRDIALLLDLSKDVTKHLLSNLFAKLGAANRSEAVGIALRKHLLTV